MVSGNLLFFYCLNSIEPLVDRPVGFVETDEGFEQFIVYGDIFGNGGKSLLILHQVGDIVEADFSQANQRDKGGSPCIGVDGAADLPDLTLHHVGKDLAPLP